MRWIVRFIAFRILRMLAVFAGIFAFLGVGWGEVQGWHNKWADSPEYAEQVFAELVPIDRVLASRRYHHWGPDWPNWDCTFAVVELATDAPELPVTSDKNATNWKLAFGGAWLETPAAPFENDAFDAVDFCEANWPAEVRDRVALALAEPGSWYIRSRLGDVIFLYSKFHGLAARIRFGD